MNEKSTSIAMPSRNLKDRWQSLSSKARKTIGALIGMVLVGAIAFAATSMLSTTGSLGAGQYAATYAEKPNTPGVIATVVPGPAGEAYVNVDGATGATTFALPTGYKLFPNETVTTQTWPVVTQNSDRAGNATGLSGTLPAGWKAELVTCGYPVSKTAGEAASPLTVQFTNVSATAPLDLGAANFKVIVTDSKSGTPKLASTFTGTCAPLVGN